MGKRQPLEFTASDIGWGYLAGRVSAARTALVWSLAQLVMELVKPVKRTDNQLFKR